MGGAASTLCGGREPRGVLSGTIRPATCPRNVPDQGRARHRGGARPRGHARPPWSQRGPCVASSAGKRARRALGHDASPIGPFGGASRLGPRTGRAGRGRRPSGPWPPCGPWVRSIPVRCRLHSTARGGSRGGGSVGWPTRCRHGRRARALQRLARQPPGRLRWKPWGKPGSRKRRIHACASHVRGCTGWSWRRWRDVQRPWPSQTSRRRGWASATRGSARPQESSTWAGPAPDCCASTPPRLAITLGEKGRAVCGGLERGSPLGAEPCPCVGGLVSGHTARGAEDGAHSLPRAEDARRGRHPARAVLGPCPSRPQAVEGQGGLACLVPGRQDPRRAARPAEALLATREERLADGAEQPGQEETCGAHEEGLEGVRHGQHGGEGGRGEPRRAPRCPPRGLRPCRTGGTGAMPAGARGLARTAARRTPCGMPPAWGCTTGDEGVNDLLLGGCNGMGLPGGRAREAEDGGDVPPRPVVSWLAGPGMGPASSGTHRRTPRPPGADLPHRPADPTGCGPWRGAVGCGAAPGWSSRWPGGRAGAGECADPPRLPAEAWHNPVAASGGLCRG